MDHRIFSAEPFNRRDAWQWLISNASFAPVQIYIAGKLIILQRGQLTHSQRFLAKAWGWDKEKVRRFTTILKSEAMIEAVNEAGQMIITICNYDKYQDPYNLREAVNEAVNEANNKEPLKNLKEKKEDSRQPENTVDAPALFDELTEALQEWNALADHSNLPKVLKLTDKRRKALKARLKEMGGLDIWGDVLEKISLSPFLTGKTGAKWRASFDWLLQPSSFIKVLEGNYGGGESGFG